MLTPDRKPYLYQRWETLGAFLLWPPKGGGKQRSRQGEAGRGQEPQVLLPGLPGLLGSPLPGGVGSIWNPLEAGGEVTCACLLGPAPLPAALALSLRGVWVFSVNIFHLYVELYVCLVQFLPTLGRHHERPFFFLKQIQNNRHDELQAGRLWKKITSPNYFNGTEWSGRGKQTPTEK